VSRSRRSQHQVRVGKEALRSRPSDLTLGRRMMVTCLACSRRNLGPTTTFQRAAPRRYDMEAMKTPDIKIHSTVRPRNRHLDLISHLVPRCRVSRPVRPAPSHLRFPDIWDLFAFFPPNALVVGRNPTHTAHRANGHGVGDEGQLSLVRPERGPSDAVQVRPSHPRHLRGRLELHARNPSSLASTGSSPKKQTRECPVPPGSLVFSDAINPPPRRHPTPESRSGGTVSFENAAASADGSMWYRLARLVRWWTTPPASPRPRPRGVSHEGAAPRTRRPGTFPGRNEACWRPMALEAARQPRDGLAASVDDDLLAVDLDLDDSLVILPDQVRSRTVPRD